MGDKIKIRMYIGTGFAGCNYEDFEEIDRSEWEAMTDKERDDYLDQAATDFLSNHIEYAAWAEGDE